MIGVPIEGTRHFVRSKIKWVSNRSQFTLFLCHSSNIFTNINFYMFFLTRINRLYNLSLLRYYNRITNPQVSNQLAVYKTQLIISLKKLQ